MTIKFFIIIICFNSTILFSANDKIVTIGGSITQIVFDLGYGGNVIAVDQSSTIPSTVADLPQVGYIRSISSEGILSVMPDIIFSSSDIGPKNVIDQIKGSGVKLKIFDSPKIFTSFFVKQL